MTEEVTGVDLVRAQLRIAAGERLAEIGLAQSDVPAARGYAIQTRVNMERMQPDGEVRPSGGMLTAFEPPSGPGVRIDTYGYPGYTTNPNFDSLLAKVIAHSASADFGDVVGRARGALSEFRIDGVETNLTFLDRALAHEDFASGAIHTRWVDAHVAELAAPTVAESAQQNGAPSAAAGAVGLAERSSTRSIRSPGSTTSARARARVRRPWPVWLPVANPRRRLWGRRTPCRFARRCRARSSRSWSPKGTRSALASRCS